MSKFLRVLFVEDSENDVKLLLMELRQGGWEIVHDRVDTAAAMQAALNAHAWDLIIADYSMPCFSGPAALVLAHEQAVDVPFILVSGKVGEEMAVQAMKAGADDYLFKGDLKRLVPAAERELRDADGRRHARKLELQLRKRDAQLNDAQRLAHLGTWHVDFRTGDTVWSDEAYRILGADPKGEPLTFSGFAAYMSTDDRAQFDKTLRASEAVSFEQDCRLSLPGMAARFVHIHGEIIRDEVGAVIEATGMIQDITERHLADVEVRQAREAAETANRAKSEFLANMSHEIRTPMTAILGFAEMMSQPNQDPADRDECIQTVRRNALHLLELINDILDLSKIEAGKMTVERIKCDITSLLAGLISLMRPRATEKMLGLEITFDGPIPRSIETDPTRLRQILLNLLGNALKFTAAGQIQLRVSTRRCESGDILCFEVVDTGIGLSADQLARLFRPFTQADESTTRKFGGTGLGLTISQQLAHLLGGTIEVKSEVGAGSTFAMCIPCGDCSKVEMLNNVTEAMLTRTEPTLKWQSVPIHGRILLVEDGRDNQRLLSTHLRASGAEVVIAENGQVAVDLMGANTFDLVLMDMQMPIMDGYSATTELRRRGVSIPVIALTAYAMEEDRQKCMACGCTDYLSKPIDRERLLQTVSRYIGKRRSTTVENPSIIKADGIDATKAAGSIKSTLRHQPGMKPIIAEFVEGLPAQVQDMIDLLGRNELSALQRIVHQLRDSSGGYGFDQITGPATTSDEAMIASSGLQTISETVNALIVTLRQIEGFGVNEEPADTDRTTRQPE